MEQKRADRRSKFWARRSLKQAWKAWVVLSRQFAAFRRNAALQRQRDEKRAQACASIRKLLQRVRALENRLKPRNDPWAHRDIREATDENGRKYWWERLPTAHRHHQDGTPKPIRRWWKDPRLATDTEKKTVRRRPVASKEPPLHVPYRLLVLQARADVAPPQKRRRRKRVVRKKALPRVASLGNPKHARHAPLHPHDVDAFLGLNDASLLQSLDDVTRLYRHPRAARRAALQPLRDRRRLRRARKHHGRRRRVHP